MTAAIVRAQAILAGTSQLGQADLRELVSALQEEWEFGLARRVLQRSIPEEPAPALYPWIVQQLAICTYKDEELTPSKRYGEAQAWLEQIGLRDRSKVDDVRVAAASLPETLALGGAVYKRRWEHDGQLDHLHQAFAFYFGAWHESPALDMGYGGVNAAYILDILAWRVGMLARRSGESRDLGRESERLKRRARALRRTMLTEIPRLADEMARADSSMDVRSKYWYLATIGEIRFGLQQYQEAGDTLAAAAVALREGPGARKNWKRQTTFHQLLGIARAQEVPPPNEDAPAETWHPAWQAIDRFLEQSAHRALSGYRGRVGLALSGGGFRASLFHLGVLARLAEVDALRGVEVLSTVSGGSIVGAHYYLLLRRLLSTRTDADITREDYIAIVRTLCRQFQKRIRQNVRMRTLTNLRVNFELLVSGSGSRSLRLGEVYDEVLYSDLGDGHADGRRRLADLLIEPPEFANRDFKPKFDNWSRRARVPMLLLNATSLNSGHNWQFTARSMGEPPGLVADDGVDANERYRRLWYAQAPTDALRTYPLGNAVAASSCVPFLFDPIVLDGLYPGRTVRLVDGGVHDNQGVGGLLNEGCTVILCSDASGQMDDKKRPGDSAFGVPLRCNDILMGRVRTAQYQDLKGRLDSRALHGLMFLHLKKELESHPLDWTRCDDPLPVPRRASATTGYGIDRDVQRKLAGIRTDLDAFTEVEASALMVSGYLMTKHELEALDIQHKAAGQPGTWGDFDIAAPSRKWRFLKLESLMRRTADSPDARRQELGRQLEVASNVTFKIWRLSPLLRSVALGGGVLMAVGLVAAIALLWNTNVRLAYSSTIGALVITIGLLGFGFFVPGLEWLEPVQAVRSYARRATLAVFGWVAASIHVRIFDRMFLKRGRVRRLLELP
jgi:predicted acylesterase/phospholipase RssA